MLVLSRKTDQEFLFPNLGIKIQVMQIKGRLVKIGIEAPEAITVLRSEILADQSIDKHRLRNELNLLQLKIDAIQLRLNRGAEMEAEPVLNQLCDSAGELGQSIAGTSFATDMDSSDPIRLLVVEDSDNERRLMAFLLASHGFSVYVARDGQEALEQLRAWNWRPQLVLMDMQMPMWDGLSALAEIRMDPQLCEIPVAAVTGVQRSEEYQLDGHGWDAWFSKPLNIPALLRYIQCLPTPQV